MMTKQRMARLERIIRESRARLMDAYPFFGILLMYLRFAAVDSIKKMSIDGRYIYFSPVFLEKLRADEVDFVLCHQLMHLLSDDLRRPRDLEGDDYHFACDIHINHELEEMGFPLERYTHLGECACMIPGRQASVEGLSKQEIYDRIPFSLYVMSPPSRSKFLIDTDTFWGYTGRMPEDGVLIIDLPSHEGVLEKDEAEEERMSVKRQGEDGNGGKEGTGQHGRMAEGGDALAVLWQERAAAAAKTAEGLSKGAGASEQSVPAVVRELLKQEKPPLLDWRRILHRFMQEEICDYAFSPPDKRYGDADFFLPDFNEKDTLPKNILFMMDTSASMKEKELAEAFTEIKGAIEQFNGKLIGELGFFDTEVTPPIPFDSVTALHRILPRGGGGTDFFSIFAYLRNERHREPPACLIIMTDGDAPFPSEDEAMHIPVLWLINNKEHTPPWGQVARFISKS